MVKSAKNNLSSALSLQPNIIPICLPSTNNLLVGKTGTVTGWGRRSEYGSISPVLREVHLPIISNKRCMDMYLQSGQNEVRLTRLTVNPVMWSYLSVVSQFWSLTQFHWVDFSQSRINEKSAFSTTHYQGFCTRQVEGPLKPISSKRPSRVRDGDEEFNRKRKKWVSG